MKSIAEARDKINYKAKKALIAKLKQESSGTLRKTSSKLSTQLRSTQKIKETMKLE
jgi:hypothetical protein